MPSTIGESLLPTHAKGTIEPHAVDWIMTDRGIADGYGEEMLGSKVFLGDHWHIAYLIIKSDAIDELYSLLSLIPTERGRREQTVQIVAQHFAALRDISRWMQEEFEWAVDIALQYLENPSINIDERDYAGLVIAHSSHFLLDTEGFIRKRCADLGQIWVAPGLYHMIA